MKENFNFFFNFVITRNEQTEYSINLRTHGVRLIAFTTQVMYSTQIVETVNRKNVVQSPHRALQP